MSRSSSVRRDWARSLRISLLAASNSKAVGDFADRVPAPNHLAHGLVPEFGSICWLLITSSYAHFIGSQCLPYRGMSTVEIGCPLNRGNSTLRRFGFAARRCRWLSGQVFWPPWPGRSAYPVAAAQRSPMPQNFPRHPQIPGTLPVSPAYVSLTFRL